MMILVYVGTVLAVLLPQLGLYLALRSLRRDLSSALSSMNRDVQTLAKEQSQQGRGIRELKASVESVSVSVQRLRTGR